MVATQRRCGGPQPVTVAPIPLALDLSLGAPGVTAEAAGPTWQGGGYWTSDGTGYWTGPTGFDASQEFEVVAWVTTGATTARDFSVGTSSTAYCEGRARDAGLYAVIRYRTASAPTTHGDRVHHAQFAANASGLLARAAVDGGGFVDASSGWAAPGAGASVFVGSGYGGSLVAAAGLSIWALGIRVPGGVLTDTDRTALAAGLADPRATVPGVWFAVWDFANAYDNGGIPTVPDLVLGDGTRDLIGTSVDIATDITTGATF